MFFINSFFLSADSKRLYCALFFLSRTILFRLFGFSCFQIKKNTSPVSVMALRLPSLERFYDFTLLWSDFSEFRAVLATDTSLYSRFFWGESEQTQLYFLFETEKPPLRTIARRGGYARYRTFSSLFTCEGMTRRHGWACCSNCVGTGCFLTKKGSSTFTHTFCNIWVTYYCLCLLSRAGRMGVGLH